MGHSDYTHRDHYSHRDYSHRSHYTHRRDYTTPTEDHYTYRRDYTNERTQSNWRRHRSRQNSRADKDQKTNDADRNYNHKAKLYDTEDSTPNAAAKNKTVETHSTHADRIDADRNYNCKAKLYDSGDSTPNAAAKNKTVDTHSTHADRRTDADRNYNHKAKHYDTGDSTSNAAATNKMVDTHSTTKLYKATQRQAKQDHDASGTTNTAAHEKTHTKTNHETCNTTAHDRPNTKSTLEKCRAKTHDSPHRHTIPDPRKPQLATQETQHVYDLIDLDNTRSNDPDKETPVPNYAELDPLHSKPMDPASPSNNRASHFLAMLTSLGEPPDTHM
jgi:hypothetical protein